MVNLERYVSVFEAIKQEVRYEKTRELLTDLKSILEISGLNKSEISDVLEVQNVSLVAHIEQKDRPDGQPYINHPIEVTLDVVNKYGLTSREVLQAALLHDTIEDQAKRLIEILDDRPTQVGNEEARVLELVREKFGSRVAELIEQLTNPDFSAMVSAKKEDRSTSIELKNELYKKHFLKKFDADVEAFLIKLADFSQNALALGNLEEGPKKDKLREKYGPVILGIVEKMKIVKDHSHPLFDKRESIIEDLSAAYARDYV